MNQFASSAGVGSHQIKSLTEQFVKADFTDGGGAAGTVQMEGVIPAGAIVTDVAVTVEEGFAGDTTCVLTVGDGSDVDRFNTGTPSIFATAATGIAMGVPSAAKRLLTALRMTLTATSGSDWGAVTAGKFTITVYYY